MELSYNEACKGGSYMTTYSYSIYSYADKSDMKKYTLTCDGFDDFKVRFLKRFGNQTGSSKASRDKGRVKRIVYNAYSIEEMANAINNRTNWGFEYGIIK